MRKIYLSLFTFLLFFTANAQYNDSYLAQQLVVKNAGAIGFSNNELGNYIVSSSYFNETSGAQMVYLNQSYKGLPVYNQMLVLAFKDGKLISKAGSFLADMDKLTAGASATAGLAAADAVRTSISDAKIPVPSAIATLGTLENGKKYNFGKLNIASENITAELMWTPVDDGKAITAVKLTWQVQLFLDKKIDYLQVRVDANTNMVVNKNTLTVTENFSQPNPVNMPAFMKMGNVSPQNTFAGTKEASTEKTPLTLSPSLVGTANYTVIPYPAESPIHPGGAAAVRTNPWTLAGGNAVSLGWHNDGTTDYTTSRGNNVWAQEDRDNNNATFGIMATSTTTPDPLNFTYAGQPDYTVAPTTPNFQQFALTNLFYWNNLVHDLTYNYGFTEPAGNFQNNNQGRGGAGADYVIADGQDAGGTNNANMSTPADGARPRMQMYLWDPVRSATTLNVNSPGTIAGPYNAVEGAFSTANLLANVGPKTGQVVWYNDDAAGNTHYACGAPVPANSVTGKIALITRGFGGAVCTATVPFTTKVKNAQDAGAIAVIMVNNVAGAPIVMGGGPDNTIIIPAVMISDVDGATIAGQLTNNVNVTLSGTAAGTIQIDGDIDNGVIAHEFFHGVSNRLTGGPANVSCLGNSEQAGEGWSDYMALIITTNWATATINDGFNIKRPIGNYAFGYSTSGPGIRAYPYSTNMAVNPLTYNDVPAAVVPHGVGTVFCTALWEMTWQLIQTAGISANVFDASGTGGNVIAFKLVMEGLKLQPCSPGFLNARDAILQADVNLYGGAHTCAIWTAFAKRGMGFSAVQGSSNNNADQTPAFDLPPACTAAAPNVTINQAAAQADPTAVSPINFTVVFDQAVTGFATGDVTLTGTAGATTGTVTGSGTTYNVAVSGMTACGTVIATIPAGVCQNAAAQTNNPSTSTDNTVTYTLAAGAPTVTINQAATQTDPTTTAPIVFTVVFSQPVTGFATGDVTLGGTATGPLTATVVPVNATTYTVNVTGMTSSGTVTATIAAGVAQNLCSQNNVASTSTDNSVTFTLVAPVTVTATAGTPGPTPYNTVKLAFDAINAGTHQGDIIVNINGNTDEGATPAVLNSTGTGASVYTSVLVRPTFDGITVTGSATPASRGVIELNGADNVTIDGDNPNTAGTNRNLNVVLTTTNAAVIIWMKTASAADGCLNNTIRNCNLTGQNTFNSISGILTGSSTFGGAAQTGNNNNTIQNNAIKRVQNGIFQSGFITAPYDVNWQVKDNIFGSGVLADKLGFRGMIINNASGYVADNNTITGINSSTGTSSTMTGIQLANASLNGTISNNKISDIRHNNTAGWGSNGIWLNSTTAASNVTVFNNFVSDVASAGFNGNTPTDNGYGIVASAGGGYNIYFNSVALNSNQPNATGRAAAFLATTSGAMNVRDNIFANLQTAGAQRYTVYSASSAAAFTDINYNEYYTATGANLGNIGATDRANIAAWRTGTGKDVNSISVPVQFAAINDLHITAGNCLLDAKGTPIAPITTDIDGAARSAATPDMGADEFAAAAPPTVNTPPNQSVCTGTLTAAVNFTGTPASGVVYNWTNNQPSIGLAASGTGNIAPFTAINTGNAPIVATITVTPVNGACPGTPVSFTITVNENPNLAIIADPGTTICEGDPTLLTVYNTAGVSPVALTQSSSQVPVAGSVSCNAGGLHTDNSYWRAYNLAPLGLPSALTVTSVNFGIELAAGGAQPVTVRLYTQDAGPAFPGGTRTLVSTQAATVNNASLTTQTVTLTTPVVVPSNAVLIVELFTPSGQATGRSFFIGSNPAAQTGPSYISAASCAITTPTDVASIGFPNMHIILNVNGTVSGVGGIATGTFLWSPAAGLSSTTTNPVAASPQNTTTYTVTRTTVPGGCVNTANITVTVNKRPVVTTQPTSITRCSGTSATFTVAGTGTGLTYQWQFSTAGCAGPWVNVPAAAPYTGTTGPVLTISSTSTLMNGYAYRCVLTGICAPWTPPTNVSNCATLTVNPLPNLVVTPPVSCGGVAGISGTALTVTQLAPPVPGSVTVNSGTINVPIPDGTNAAATSNLTVAGIPANATVTDVKINMNINHTWVGDVDVNIKAPNAAILNLVAGLDGGTGGNATDNFTNTAFSSLGGSTISGAAAPRTDTYTAEARAGRGPVGFLQTVAAWSGLYSTPNGVWTLAMGDRVGTDVGALTNWSITINYTTPGTGPLPAVSYVWSPVTGLYTLPNGTGAYTGQNLSTVYAAPTAQTTYTVSATNTATGCVGTATALVNYTPPAPTVTPNPVAMCLGDAAVKLKSSSSSAGSVTFNSGTLALAIPDGPATWPQTSFPGVTTPNLAVSGIPAGATITGMSVKLNLTHTYIADMVIVLKAPNGNVFNLDAVINRTGGPGANFVNTIISSAGTTALSAGAPPYTGTFAPDAAGATFVAAGFTFPGGPTSPAGYIPTVSNFSGLYSVPNGNYTLGIYDWGAGDLGTLTNWELTVNYVLGVPASPAVWTPNGPGSGLFSDAAASVVYNGAPQDSVWARPTPAGVYNYQVRVNNLVSTTATPTTPMAGGNGNNLVTFNVKNNNTFPVTLSSISSNTFGSGAVTSTVYYKTTGNAGNPGAISAANGFVQFGTAPSTVTAGAMNVLVSGTTLQIPAGATYGIAIDMTGATFPAYTNGTGTVATYSNGGVDIITDGNVGWGGPNAPAAPVNNPRNFNGSITFLGTGAGTCTSPPTTVTVTVNTPTTLNATLPADQTVCTDKVATFTAVASGSGPFSYQWQVSTDFGNTFSNISNGGVYSGVNTATLTIAAPPVSMSGYQYRVIVTGAAPCGAVTSRKAILTVNPLPVITISPLSSSLFPGLTATISSTVTPNAAATYTWIRDGVTLTSGSLGVLSGIGTGTLRVDVDGMGVYSLRVTDVNGCTNTSNSAVVKDSASGRCFIYPNPTSGRFQVRYYSVAGNNNLPRGIVVYDAKGDRVYNQNYTIGRPYDRMDVDMRAFGKGLYWVEIVDRNGNRLSMCRVVIQ